MDFCSVSRDGTENLRHASLKPYFGGDPCYVSTRQVYTKPQKASMDAGSTVEWLYVQHQRHLF
jgi:hypothetical protein